VKLDTVNTNMTQEPQPPRRRAALFAAAALPFLSAGPASAATIASLPLAVSWWLPQNYSKHGPAIDSLFNWIFWITMITFVAVQVVLVVFLIKYRHRPGAKGIFIHGNTRLEMAWTLAPAVILALLAFFSKGVWTNYRYAQDYRAPGENAAKVMVIGERFKWNVIYPGPDGEFGRYLLFPKPTDRTWPGGEKYANVEGPRFLPRVKVGTTMSVGDAINGYIEQDNPLGKDGSDPKGKDDNWEKRPGRALEVPVNRPVDVYLSSKDVIHSFTLVNFRVKLDTVPGMRGVISFTPTVTSKELEAQTRKSYKPEELLEILKDPKADLRVYIDEKSPMAEQDAKTKEFLYREKTAKKPTIIRNANPLSDVRVLKLKELGLTEIAAYRPFYWEITCEDLFGECH
jgi:heme/copper-type cytochrome/quinol oxidase subunit 2